MSMLAKIKGAGDVVKKRVENRIETVHAARVAVVHKVRGTREDGLLGKTELEARMYQASREERFGEAALLKERLEAILEATERQKQAAAAKAYAEAEEWNHKLNVLRVREPFELLLEQAAAARDARGDVRQRKASKASRLSSHLANRSHYVRVTTAYRLRGRRRDGGLGKTELEALSLEAEARGQEAQAAFLRVRHAALVEAAARRKEALERADTASLAKIDEHITRLRDRAPFMRELAALHDPSLVSASGAQADSAECGVLGDGDLIDGEALMLHQTASYSFNADAMPVPEAHDSVAIVPAAAAEPVAEPAAAAAPARPPAPAIEICDATVPAGTMSPVVADKRGSRADAAAGLLSPQSAGDGCSSYESFMEPDPDWYAKAKGVSSTSDGGHTFGR